METATFRNLMDELYGQQGVQHHEHSVLCAGPGGRDRLLVVHSESPPVADGHLTYAWCWAAADEQPTEQSKADVRLLTAGEA